MYSKWTRVYYYSLLFGKLRGKCSSFHFGGFKKSPRQFQLKHTCKGPPVSGQTVTQAQEGYPLGSVSGEVPHLGSTLSPPPSLTYPTGQDANSQHMPDAPSVLRFLYAEQSGPPRTNLTPFTLHGVS